LAQIAVLFTATSNADISREAVGLGGGPRRAQRSAAPAGKPRGGGGGGEDGDRKVGDLGV